MKDAFYFGVRVDRIGLEMNKALLDKIMRNCTPILVKVSCQFFLSMLHSLVITKQIYIT